MSSSRGALIAALLFVGGVLVYLVLRGGEEPQPVAEAPSAAASEATVTGADPRRASSVPAPVVETTHTLRGRTVAGDQPVAGAIVTVTARRGRRR